MDAEVHSKMLVEVGPQAQIRGPTHHRGTRLGEDSPTVKTRRVCTARPGGKALALCYGILARPSTLLRVWCSSFVFSVLLRPGRCCCLPTVVVSVDLYITLLEKIGVPYKSCYV